MREHGAGYPAWVLDKIGIETMFANRVAHGRGHCNRRVSAGCRSATR